MRFLFDLVEKHRFLYVKLFALAVVNSVWAVCLLMFINGSAARDSSGNPALSLILYTAIIALSFFSSWFFQRMLIGITSETSYDFQKKILNELRFTSLQDFEKLKTERVYTAINDSRVISEFPESIIETFNSLVFVICGFCYLIWLTPAGGAIVLAMILVLAARYIVSTKAIEKDVFRVRELEDSYYRSIDDFVRGFKQLKMSSSRSDNFYGNFMDKNRKLTKDLSEKLYVRFLFNNLLGYYSWYLLIGFIIFVLPIIISLPAGHIGMFTVSLLFLMNPLMTAVRLIPTFSRVRVAYTRLDEFMCDIHASHKDAVVSADVKPVFSDFEFVEFRDVSFIHESSHDRAFVLGPVNIRINRGEVIFLTGGNGSGKSTFVNLLTGMYAPAGGALHFNDKIIDDHNYPEYRNRISPVFTDHHLFSENYDDFVLTSINEELKEHIRLFKLTEVIGNSHPVELHAKLSKGQQKRLALIYALLERKDIIILDEWAAEQDPEFRDYFYNVIIQELALRGKTIIAVTHDDRYFHCATRIVKFDYGKIVADHYVQEHISAPVK